MAFDPKNYHGLFIGSGWGQHWGDDHPGSPQSLKGAPRDARLMQHLFTKHLGHEPRQFIGLRSDAPHSHQKPTLANLKREVAALRARIESNPKAVVILYYSGHGIDREDDLALPAYCSKSGAIEGEHPYGSLMNDLIRPLLDAPPHPADRPQLVVILDCCGAQTGIDAFKAIRTRGNLHAIAACAIGARAFEFNGLGVFTAHLMKIFITRNSGEITASILSDVSQAIDSQRRSDNTGICPTFLESSHALCIGSLREKTHYDQAPSMMANTMLVDIADEDSRTIPGDAVGIPSIATPNWFICLGDTGPDNTEALVVPVTSEGFLVGPYYEGRLGVVVGVYRISPEKALHNPNEEPLQLGTPSFALKFPRLVAESPEENQFILQILDREQQQMADLVRHANDHDYGRQYPELREVNMNDLPVAEPSPLNGAKLVGLRRYWSGEAALTAQYQDSSLWLTFGAGKAPRLTMFKHPVSKTKKGKALKGKILIPGTANESPAFKSLVDNLPVNFVDFFGKESEYFTEPVEICDHKIRPAAEFVKTRVESAQSQIRWYGALPSIIMPWYPRSFQETVEKRHWDEKRSQSSTLYRSWRLVQHLKFLKRISEGLGLMHVNGVFHGDLRPANLFLGSKSDVDPANPKSYLVGDYGSYKLQGEAASAQLAIAVGHYRQSPFYAPERLGGTEYETGNVALMLKLPEEQNDILIRFGWGAQMATRGRIKEQCLEETLKCRSLGIFIDEDTKLRRCCLKADVAIDSLETCRLRIDELKRAPVRSTQEKERISGNVANAERYADHLEDTVARLIDEIRGAAKETDDGARKVAEIESWNSSQPVQIQRENLKKVNSKAVVGATTSTEDVQEGDFIEFNHYLFRIKAAWKLDGDFVFHCEPTYWRVKNQRMTVEVKREEAMQEKRLLAVSGFTHYPQWSNATDIYSLGVLTFYTAFFASETEAMVDSGGTAKQVFGVQSTATEKEFGTFLATVSQEAYFNSFWVQLAWFWHQIDCAADTSATPYQKSCYLAEPFASHTFSLKPGDTSPSASPTTLPSYCRRIALDIVTSTPGARRLLENLRWNTGELLMLFTFGMACIHRRKPQKHLGQDFARAPFCESRIRSQAVQGASKEPKEAALAAAGTLIRFVELVDQDCFKGLGDGGSERSFTLLSDASIAGGSLVNTQDKEREREYVYDEKAAVAVKQDYHSLVKLIEQQETPAKMRQTLADARALGLHAEDDMAGKLEQLTSDLAQLSGIRELHRLALSRDKNTPEDLTTWWRNILNACSELMQSDQEQRQANTKLTKEKEFLQRELDTRRTNSKIFGAEFDALKKDCSKAEKSLNSIGETRIGKWLLKRLGISLPEKRVHG